MDAIFHRTSIRKYRQQEVEEAKVEKLLRAAMAAPSAKNQQPWEFYVVTEAEKRKELGACSPYAGPAAAAPLVIAVCTRKNCAVPDYAQIDASAAVENILLEADSLGLGAVWLGIAPNPGRQRCVEGILGMPEELEAFALIACGYPEKVNPQQDRYDGARVHFVR